MSFSLNFQTSTSTTFTLKDKKITMNITIRQLKHLICWEKGYEDIYLEFNNKRMEDSKTLDYYGIRDDKNLIKLKVGVNQSSEYKEEQKDSAGASYLFTNLDQTQAWFKLNNAIKNLEKQLKTDISGNLETKLLEECKVQYDEVCAILQKRYDEVVLKIKKRCGNILQRNKETQTKKRKDLKELRSVQDECMELMKLTKDSDLKHMYDEKDISVKPSKIVQLVEKGLGKVSFIELVGEPGLKLETKTNEFKKFVNSSVLVLQSGAKISSKILKESEQNTLVELVETHRKKNEKWNFLYRGSEHGFSYEEFYSICINKTNTIAIIQSNSGNVFGGFTSIPLEKTKNSNARRDSEAFLYLIKSNAGDAMLFPML